MSTLSTKLAQNIAVVDKKQIGNNEIEIIKDLLTDYLAVAIGGAYDDAAKPLHKFLVSQSNDSIHRSHVFSTNIGAAPATASLINGVFAHLLDYDDVDYRSPVHLGTVIFPAVLAMAEAYKKTGLDFLIGILCGYEVLARIALAIKDKQFSTRGFNTTALCGAFGAAAGVSKILGHDDQKILHALGLVGHMTSGLIQQADGETSRTLSWSDGWAAHAGVMAAKFSDSGFLGDEKIFEGKYGFIRAYIENIDNNLLLDNFYKDWAIYHTSIKFYPCCGYIQTAVSSLFNLLEKIKYEIDAIQKIKVEVTASAYDMVCQLELLDGIRITPNMAKIDLPITLALVLRDKNLTNSQYEALTYLDNELMNYVKLIECVTNETFNSEYAGKFPAKVTLYMKNNDTHTAFSLYPKGDVAGQRLSRNEIRTKFNLLTSNYISDIQKDKIFDFIDRLEYIQDFSEFSACF